MAIALMAVVISYPSKRFVSYLAELESHKDRRFVFDLTLTPHLVSFVSLSSMSA